MLNRDDYLRPLRALLREIWRTLRSELNLAAFSRSLMSQTEPLPRDCEFSQRAFTATADLITLCMFLATATFARPDKKEPQITVSFLFSPARSVLCASTPVEWKKSV